MVVAVVAVVVVSEPILIWVSGLPKPKGSKRVITRARGGRPLPFPRVLDDSPGVKAWQKRVGGAARKVCAAPIDSPVGVSLDFVFARAKSHRTPRGQLRKRAPETPGHNLGDVDKLARSTLDGLNKIAIRDDTLVVWLLATKRFHEVDPETGALEAQGCWIRIATAQSNQEAA